MKTGSANYGLVWFLQTWNGMKVVQHGGNIDGFNALVAMLPENKLGFVMLTNVSGSPLRNELMPLVWHNILGETKSPRIGQASRRDYAIQGRKIPSRSEDGY